MITQSIDGKSLDSSMTKHSFFPRYTTSDKTLKIVYDDVEGHRYNLSFTVIPSKHPGLWDGNVRLGTVCTPHTSERNGIKKFIDRILGWYP